MICSFFLKWESIPDNDESSTVHILCMDLEAFYACCEIEGHNLEQLIGSSISFPNNNNITSHLWKGKFANKINHFSLRDIPVLEGHPMIRNFKKILKVVQNPTYNYQHPFHFVLDDSSLLKVNARDFWLLTSFTWEQSLLRNAYIFVTEPMRYYNALRVSKAFLARVKDFENDPTKANFIRQWDISRILDRDNRSVDDEISNQKQMDSDTREAYEDFMGRSYDSDLD